MLVILSVFTISLFFGFNITQTSAAYTCGSSTKCKSAKMTYGKQQYVASGSIYFSKGDKLIYEWDNDSPGIMQVGFSVYNSSGVRVTTKLGATGRVGNNYGIWEVTKSGSYYLFAECEGGNDTRCQGGGTIRGL